MNGQIAWAVGIVILAGLLSGTFAAPMKRMATFRCENSWLLFAISGLLIFPWLVTFATVPHVASVYAGASRTALLQIALFGLAWRVGSTLFGVGISRVGLALGFANILRITRRVRVAAPACSATSAATLRQARVDADGWHNCDGGRADLSGDSRSATRTRTGHLRSARSGFTAGADHLHPFRNSLFHAELQLGFPRRVASARAG